METDSPVGYSSKPQHTSSGDGHDTNSVNVSLLVLFMTWRDSCGTNTCYNWRALTPLVRPVLLADNPSVSRECRENGWTVFPLSKTVAGETPVLKRFNSIFYGYSNGDTVYGQTFLKILQAVEDYVYFQKSPL